VNVPENITRAEQTKYLSKEFVVGLIIQLIAFLVIGGVAYGSITTEVSNNSGKIQDLKSNQVSGERVKALEVEVANLKEAVIDLNGSVRELNRTIERRKRVDPDQ
jgi:signal transduction histidine kinase